MANELKPCPFCGGKAFARPNLPTYGSDVMYYVFCENCNIRTPLKWTTEKAIEVWNNRAESEELKFTRQFIHEHGLEFALAAAWKGRAKDGT